MERERGTRDAQLVADLTGRIAFGAALDQQAKDGETRFLGQGRKGADYVRGVAKLEKRLIILMDLHRVLFAELREGAAAP